MGRGTLLAHASTDQDKHDINRYIRIKKRFENMNYDMKRKMMRRIVKLAIGKNTFEVSYTGRVGWSGRRICAADHA